MAIPLSHFTITHHAGVTTLSAPCVVTGKLHAVQVATEQFNAYAKGTLAQVAFPNESADVREFLISGISPDGWDQTFNTPPTEPEEQFDRNGWDDEAALESAYGPSEDSYLDSFWEDQYDNLP